MNRILLLSWMYGRENECKEGATSFFKKLREGTKQGNKFPFDCPYQVALIRNTKASEWLVAVLVMRGTQGDDSAEQNDKLQEWFDACGASGWHSKIGKPVYGDTIQSSLDPKWSYRESFGAIKEETSAITDQEKKWWQFWK